MQYRIPNHLKKYTVEQEYSQYTYIDQACWRFIMKISIDFFKSHADNIYIQGLKKTGITTNRIPKIKAINNSMNLKAKMIKNSINQASIYISAVTFLFFSSSDKLCGKD